jgi:hypothetical protein
MPSKYRTLTRQIAEMEGVDPDLFELVIGQESNFRPDARSPAGAIGLAQLMPGTASDLGVDPTDPVDNLRGGARYLRQQIDAFDGDIGLALAAYNAGPGNVRKYGGIPPFRETENYVSTILGKYGKRDRLPDVASPLDMPEDQAAYKIPMPEPDAFLKPIMNLTEKTPPSPPQPRRDPVGAYRAFVQRKFTPRQFGR